MPQIEEAISRAVERYNHYRSPEVKAKLIKAGEGGFTVDFEGPFCKSCGIYDYFKDLIYELNNVSEIQAEITGFENTESETVRVIYAIRVVSHNRKVSS
jgi:hypothetical protein